MSTTDSEKKVVIVDGVRTPFTKAGSVMKDIDAVHLGAYTLRTLIDRTNLSEDEIDEVIIGCV